MKPGDRLRLVVEIRALTLDEPTMPERPRPPTAPERADGPSVDHLPAKALLSIDEVCSILGAKRTSVSRLIRSGELPSLKVGRLRRVRTETLRTYLAERETGPWR